MSTQDAETQEHWLLAAVALGVVAMAAVAVMLAIGLGWDETRDEQVISRGRPGVANPVATPQAGSGSDARARRLFSPTSFWNKRLPADAAVDPNSSELIDALVAEVNREQEAGNGPWLATRQASTPLYRVGRAQARIRVRLDSKGVKGAKALEQAFAKVPIPEDAAPAKGSDRHMTVWQPSTDTLWEFWGARRRADGWHAKWGGAIRRVSTNRGYYTETAWPGATRNWGATASSLPVIGGTILAEELQAGRIDHALALNVPAARTREFAWPAQRTDGNGASTTLPEGSRLRLDPQLDLRELKLPRLTRMIAIAAQRHGLVVRDQTGQGISLFAEDPTPLGDDPYGRFLAGRTPAELLGRIPWDRLQVVRMRLCSEAPCQAP